MSPKINLKIFAVLALLFGAIPLKAVAQNTHYHTGLDLDAKIGTPIFAMEDGVVILASDDIQGYGAAVYIQHRQGIQTRYGHLTPSSQGGLKVQTGDLVKKGDIIGLSGKSGVAIAPSVSPHIHLEIRNLDHGITGNPKRSWLDPLPFLKVK